MIRTLVTIFLGAVSLTLASAHANDGDFVPAYAADQARITADSMKYEADQFAELSNWRSLGDQLAARRTERDTARDKLNRLVELKQSGGTSQAEIDQARYVLDLAESEIARVEGVRRQAGTLATIAKLRLQDAGGSGDFRKALALATEESMRYQRQALSASRSGAVHSVEYFRQRYENGLELFEKKVISKVELDRRLLEFNNARDSVRSFDHRIRALEDSLEGVRRSLEKL